LDITLAQFVIGSLITLIGIASTYAISQRKLDVEKQKVELSELRFSVAQKELKFQAAAMDFSVFLADWSTTAEEFKRLIDETTVDRILILRAWNGNLAPEWTTAVFQMREYGQEPMQYVHVGLDSDYVERLRKMTGRGQLYFKVADIDGSEESMIKRIYDAEGVTASYWAHIESLVTDNDSRAVSYISFSTHDEEGMDEATRTRCMLLSSRLKGIASAFRLDHTEANA